MRIRLFLFAMLLCMHATLLHGVAQLEVAFPNLSFLRPVDLQTSRDGTNRIFVVEQRGVIRVFDNSAAATETRTFLDIQDRIYDLVNEAGLLGLAFHPHYADSGYFYVNYTAASPLRTVIARYSVTATDPDSADYDSELVLVEVPQPFGNHNGGQIAFGPDGFLYIGLGDGGSGGDPLGNGQNLQTWLGALLRIDVDTTTVVGNYGIPVDNPFAGNMQGYKEEIYAYGLRNPWRFSFDPLTGRLWLADVGQADYEEIDIIESGGNYGWNIMEGPDCFNPPSGCDTTGLELPVWEYDHTVGGSITGGYVYTGSRLPSLYEKYVYGDFSTGKIWALAYDGLSAPVNIDLIDTSLLIASFGVAEDNELFICAFDGLIYQFASNPTGVVDEGAGVPRDVFLGQNYPNPFNPSTVIHYEVAMSGRNVTLQIYDVTGRLVRTLVDGYETGGHRTTTWDGKDDGGQTVSTGVYFYQLNAKGFSETRKMVLIK
ncbi:MAG: PQQ-dependent sugar dehydrogenase [Candidatus Krumholzibacteria bacterium]|nr:PQQ-dependent sugar dehydrogenase [Candidatus Krumholzibacteria bacterium]